MNWNRRLAISLSAAVLSGLLVYGVYVLQLRQVRLQETATVVVPRQFVAAGDTLTAAQLDVKRLPLGAITEEMIRDPDEVVGMEVLAPLGAGEPLLRWKLDRYRLLPRKGEATFQIPRDYIRSIASGIRAGDLAVIYLSDTSGASQRLFRQPVVVAGVKTSGNQEIDNPKNSNLLSMANGDKERMYASRRDANGTIDTINLNLTEEQWLLIDAVCKSGEAKLVVAYASNALDAMDEGRNAG
jgi:hypothetical protein